jgi:tetratricopeptide (TPR) repeat protein
MLHAFRAAALAAVMTATALGQSAPSPPSAPAKPDLSKEAFVVLESRALHRFEADGTGRRESYARIKVQNEGGVQYWGQLAFGYNSASEQVVIEYVRVHKQDGTVVTAPLDAVQDLTSPVQRIAPVYTDFKQRHVTVPSLRPGETLEFKVATHVHTALAPGHFWTEYDFAREFAVLDEQFVIDVPASAEVTLRTGPGHTPVTATADGRRVYRWSASHLPDRDKEEKEAEEEEEPDEDNPRRAAVRLTTFKTWGDVARWYGGLEASQRRPTPEIRRKAEELVKGATTPHAKAEALYNFVAKNFRYVSLSLGMGRYQPRPAAEVLRDQYGDCKDKHTLLASLLESVGLQSHAALVNSQVKIDPDFPSPSQFDHVITRVSAAGDTIWLDTTTEIAPFRLLASNLRRKSALVVSPDRPQLEDTPADPPMMNRSAFSMDAAVDEAGKLTGTVRMSARGDVELLMRTIFRATPPAQWKAVFDGIHKSLGIGGEVSDWKVGDVANTAEPFSLQYAVTLPRFVDRTKKEARQRLPVLELQLPEFKEDKARTTPLKLGSPMEQETTLSLKLPATLSARAPLPVAVARDYANYQAVYEAKDGLVSARRVIKITQSELPPTRVSDYAAFRRAVLADLKQQLALEGPPVAATAAADANADDLLRDGLAAFQGRNYKEAVVLLERVVAAEPAHRRAWGDLGRAQLALQQLDGAVASFKKQLEINAFDEYAYPNLGLALYRQRKHQEAEAAFKKQLELNPLDGWTYATLGEMYVEWGKYDLAVASLDKALSLNPKQAGLYVDLGQAHLNAGREAQALAAFDKAVELEPTAPRWNDIAYQLALKGVALDRALRYAESAVTAAAVSSRNITVDALTSREIALTESLAAYWDTLGWVHVAMGNLDKAEGLVSASWHLGEHSEVADHLAQIHERRNRRDDALMMYALALRAERPADETRQRLSRLAGSEAELTRVLAAHPHSVLDARRTHTVELDPMLDKPADVFLLIGAGGVQAAKFVEDVPMTPARLQALQRLPLGRMLPAGSDALVVRRGALACTPKEAKTARLCTLTLHRLDRTRPPS